MRYTSRYYSDMVRTGYNKQSIER